MESLLLKRFIKIFLLAAGIFEFPNGKLLDRVYSFFITIIFFIQIFGNYVGYKTGNLNLEQIVEMIFRLTGHTYVLLIHWLIKLNKVSVLRITHTLSGNYPPFVEDQVTKITEKSFKSVGILTLAIYAGAMLTYMSMSIFIGLFTKLRAEEVYIYLFPAWYSCENEFTVIRFSLCWSVNSYTSYLMKNGCQFGLMFIEQLSLLNSVFLYLLLIFNFQAHKIVLERRLSTARAEVDKFDKLYWQAIECNSKKAEKWKKKRDMMANKAIFKFIRYHQFLCGFFAEIKSILAGLLSQVLFFIWLLMLFTLCFVMVEEDGGLIYRMKVGSLVVMTILVFYTTCYLGEFIYDLNYSFLSFFYEASWMNLSVNLKKIIAIQFILLQKPFRIKAFGMYLINMECFAFSIRTMYTVLNMLLITLKKS